MIINVNDSNLNLILNSCFVFIVILFAISLIPWKLKSGKNRWTLTLPFLAIFAYGYYEMTMPANWDIRMDLLILWPLLAVIVLLGIIRGAIVWRHVRNEKKNEVFR